MKKSLLFATALCLCSASAKADITNPFYIPEKGFLTDSKISIGRRKLDGSITAPAFSGSSYMKNGKQTRLSEGITYGITSTWAVYGNVGYDWLKQNNAGSFQDWDWTIGTKINTIDEAWRVQVGAEITRTDYTQWKDASNRDRKNTTLYVMAGTETGENVFFYTKFKYQNIDFGDNQGYNIYSADAALHLTARDVAGDVGLQFAWDNLKNWNHMGNKESIRNRDLTFFGGAYMNVRSNMAVGLDFDYVLASTNSIKAAYAPDNQGSYSLGFNVKYEF